MVTIPRYLDAQAKVIMWDMDEFAAFLLCFMLGIFIHQIFIMILVGYMAAEGVAYFKKGKSQGYMLHYMYWLGFVRIKGFPASYQRTFLE